MGKTRDDVDWVAVAEYAKTHTAFDVAATFFGGNDNVARGLLRRRGIEYVRCPVGRMRKIPVECETCGDVDAICDAIMRRKRFLTQQMVDTLSVIARVAADRMKRAAKRKE